MELDQQIAQMSQMQDQINNLREQLGQAESTRQAVQQMFDEGVIKQTPDGRYQAVLDPEESEQLRSVQAQISKRRPIREADIDRINANIQQEEQKR